MKNQSLKINLEGVADALHEKDIRIRFIGSREPFSASLCEQIAEAESKTRDNQLMTVNVALNYGGHWDIANAVRALANRVHAGEIHPDDLNEASISSELSLAGSPDPDLFIRTGGEKRISNFLLWQLAYTELYFCDCLWPDFADEDMDRAMAEYARRQRRFGQTGEQIESPA